MESIYSANWIRPTYPAGEAASEFFRAFSLSGEIKQATLSVSALGVYSALVNGQKVSYPLAPGFTDFEHRVQYQTYDVTALLKKDNRLSVTVACGWRMPYGWDVKKAVENWGGPEIEGNGYAVIAALSLCYADGREELIVTDNAWQVRETKWRSCNIYNGDIYDETFEGGIYPVRTIQHDVRLVPQEGELIEEHESFKPIAVIHTPKGETVLDFGQNMTGYVSFSLTVPKGKTVILHHGEILDHEGNFYNDNYRAAKAEIRYTGDGTRHTWKPEFTFYGFRYVRLTKFYGEVNPEDFTAIVVHSHMERRGYFECSDERVNKLYHNIIWGQKGNFLDIPTDCPQRDERLGWTGDAQVFARCAMYNYDTRRFFRKWLADMRLSQRPNGAIPNIIPRLDWVSCSCGWGDVAVILPWQYYLMYGDVDILSENYDMMRRWVDYMYREDDAYISRNHFGDWLAMDAKEELDCGGGTSKRYLALAFRAYSTELLVKITKILGRDGSISADYIAKHDATVMRIRKEFFKGDMLSLEKETQTGYVIALKFGLCEEKMRQTHADRLAEMIHENGDLLTTGFLGTPYLMHMLTEHGYIDLAYTLLFQTKVPSWLYAVEHGATTMWEHWDGIRKDGTVWDVSMNSYNHYAYGAVGDWLYGTVAGIETDEQNPGFAHVRFAPMPTERLTFAKATLNLAEGVLSSEWHRHGEKVTYCFSVPEGHTAEAVLGEETIFLEAGVHSFTR